jgi:XTP/dITP diphosphohydrolase
MRFTLATTNKSKIKEFEAIFKQSNLKYRVELLKTKEIQSTDLKEIARESVIYAYNILREPVLVEDAGLFIRSLNGFPGPYSSYVYRTIGVDGILKLMSNITNRSAIFHSVIAFYSPYTGVKLFSGEAGGEISYEPRGTSGFGFDPIFIPEEGDGRTFAEMEVHEKNNISHRGKAARKFIEWITGLKTLPPPYAFVE